MSENSIETQVKAALDKARSNLKNSCITPDDKQEINVMIHSIDDKIKQLVGSRAQLVNFIQEHTNEPRM